MGDATETVELVGGPLDGGEYPVRGRRIYFPGRVVGRDPETGGPIFSKTVYADTGRRTAAGRRVFAPAG